MPGLAAQLPAREYESLAIRPLGHLERALLEAIKRVADWSDPDLRLSLVLGAQAVSVAYTGPVEGCMVALSDLPNKTPYRGLAPPANRRSKTPLFYQRKSHIGVKKV
jgi:hypothetical protein